MENTLENKAKFFALHWGQEICLITSRGEKLSGIVDEDFICLTLHETSIELKPLHQITDEDAIKVAEFIYPIDSFFDAFFDTKWESNRGNEGFFWLDNLFNNDYSISFNSEGFECYRANSREIDTILNAIDFLRSKGYAMPYMGISVSKLIEWGWIKLK